MKTVKLLIIITIAMTCIVACKKKKSEQTTTKEELATYPGQKVYTTCFADSSWFTIDPKTGKRKTPAPNENSSSVFGNNTTVSNCDFHQWSWQKFLWLTNDISGEPSFMKNLIQVDNQNTPVAKPGSNKIILSSKENLQATGDILRSNSAFSKDGSSYDVYYSIHVDSTLFNSTLYSMRDSMYIVNFYGP